MPSTLRAEGFVLSFSDGRSVPLPPALVDVVRTTAGELANGQSVTILRAETTLTPAEAAELLGLSRPFVVRLLDEGDIPSEFLFHHGAASPEGGQA
jgi:hypothetical protein